MIRRRATDPLSSGYGPSVLEFRLLGPLEVVGDDGPLQLGGPKQRATLAILLLGANRVVPVERLATTSTTAPLGDGGHAGATPGLSYAAFSRLP